MAASARTPPSSFSFSYHCIRYEQLNVEYNQLDPLLREADGAGDVNDEGTGFSPYPGNINQLVFALIPYSKASTACRYCAAQRRGAASFQQ